MCANKSQFSNLTLDKPAPAAQLLNGAPRRVLAWIWRFPSLRGRLSLWNSLSHRKHRQGKCPWSFSRGWVLLLLWGGNDLLTLVSVHCSRHPPWALQVSRRRNWKHPQGLDLHALTLKTQESRKACFSSQLVKLPALSAGAGYLPPLV